MAKQEKEVQAGFFQSIKSQLAKHVSLVDEVADCLNLSPDSAYRRIRGETSLSMLEIVEICRYFNVSFDQLTGQKANQVSFEYRPLHETSFNFLQYLRHIEENLKIIAAAEEKEVVYMANEIPLFHLMHAPELASFKLFFWQKTILDFSEFRSKKFKLYEIDEEVNQLSRSVRDLYVEIPSIEIYHSETIDTTLKQIEYYVEAGFFEKHEEALLLLDKVSEVMDHIRLQCEQGHKFRKSRKQKANNLQGGTYTVFHNEVLHMDNAILVKMGQRYLSFLTSNGLNSLLTKSDLFYEEYYRALKVLQGKSTLISGSSEKERNKVFINYQRKIDVLKKRLSLI